jgi:hypothetical protein
MAEQMTGVVEDVNPDNKRFKLNDGNWYSSWNPVEGLGVGKKVSFRYNVKGTYRNVSGTVRVSEMGSVVPAAVGSGGVGASPDTARAAPSRYSRGSFPIDPLDGQRSIIRQNALTHATEVYLICTNQTDLTKMKVEDIADNIIQLANRFERYAAGDLDREAAEKAMLSLSETETI